MGIDKIYYVKGVNKYIIDKEKKERERNLNKNIVVENITDAAEFASETDEESDYIYKHILHATKLLEGRVSIHDIAYKYTIPEVQLMVKNEMALIHESQNRFRKYKEVNVYTKQEALSAAALFRDNNMD